MTADRLTSVKYFLKHQVFRSDYLIVDERRPLQSQFPYELKLERLHTLCISQGYRTSTDCEDARRQLYAVEHHENKPAALLLTEAYLPQCVKQYSMPRHNLDDSQEQPLASRDVELLLRVIDYRSSWLEWERDWYRLRLPVDVHSLLIEHDGALLAA